MGDSYETIRVAAVQAASVFLDRQATILKACRLIREAGQQGARVIVFPEGFVPAHPIWYQYHLPGRKFAMDMSVRLFKNAVEVPGPEISLVCDAAREAHAYIVLGVCEKRPNSLGTLYNTQVFIGPDGYIGKHQKLVPTITERLVHSPGAAETFGAFQTDFGPASALICGENSNPLAVFALAAEGTRVHSMSWPATFGVGGQAIQSRVVGATQAFAQMTKAFVISACATIDVATIEALNVSDEDEEFLRKPTSCGGSVIVAPNAEILAGPMGNEEGILFADLDLELGIRMKFMSDITGHYNRPDIFQLTVNKSTPKLFNHESNDSPHTPSTFPKPTYPKAVTAPHSGTKVGPWPMAGPST